MRHNSVTDSDAQTTREVCRDVQTELTLLPINENDYERKVNTADNARLDISARELWNSCEKTFFDIRITHPTSQSYSGKSLAEVYQQHEKEKDKYNQNVTDIEVFFQPLVFTTCGGMAMQQSQQKTGRKNSWKTQGAICIGHDIFKDKAQICLFEKHPCCNTRILGQTKWWTHLGPHRHWLQLIPMPTIIQSWSMMSMT